MDRRISSDFDGIVEYLVEGYWDDAVGVAGGRRWLDDRLTYAFDGEWRAGERAAVRDSLAVWTDVADVAFAPAGGDADVTFVATHAGAGGVYAASLTWAYGGTVVRNEIHLNVDRFALAAVTDAGSYERTTLIHEIGHTLGLGHPGPYNGGGSYGADAVFATDTRAHSVMSYWSAAHAGADHNGRFATTPLLYDIAAVQRIWGAATATRAGDTTYGFNTAGLDGADAFVFARGETPVVALWDGGGEDSLDLSGFDAPQRVDLAPGTLSDVGAGARDNLTIAAGVWIENAVGGSGADRLAGNARANRLDGGAGDDVLTGHGGADRLTGGAGDDRLDGGAGHDVAAYAGARADFIVTPLAGGAVALADIRGGEGRDTLHGIEAVTFAAGRTTVAVADLVAAADAHAGAVVAEVGRIDGLTHRVRTIELDHRFDDPVVLALTPTRRGGDPVAVRLIEVRADGFDVRLQEPNERDGRHVGEDVGFLVVEAGSWQLADGTRLEAGTLANDRLTSAGFETVAFATDFADTPAVLSQVQSARGGDFVVTRQRGVDADGFELAMQEEQARNHGGHVGESLGWLAIDAGAGRWDGHAFAAGRTENAVTRGGYALDRGDGADGDAVVLAALASFNGADPAWLRRIDPPGGAVELAVEEETSADRETWHTRERADWLVVEGTGTLHGGGAPTAARAGDVVAEVGRIDGLTHRVRTIELDHRFDDPVVLAQAPTRNGGDPVAVRLVEVRADGFDVRLQEPNDRDGRHVGEDVSFLVVEAGSWRLADGTRLEAGTVATHRLTAEGFETVAFADPFARPPVALSQAQTCNGGDFVTTRQRAATAAGFELALEEEEARNAGGHRRETVGWVAMEEGAGTLGALDYAAMALGGVRSGGGTRVDFDGFTETPHVLAGLATFRGWDPAHLRLLAADAGGARLAIEEDRSADAETWHTAETAGVIALAGDDVLTGVDWLL